MIYQRLYNFLIILILAGLAACGMRGGSEATPAVDPTTAAVFVAAPVAGSAADLTIFGDTLTAGWQDWSWGSTVNPANLTPVQRGAASLAVTYTEGWAGLSLRAPAALDATVYATLTLSLHGGASGTRALQLFVQQSDGGGESNIVPIDAPAGRWSTVAIPLATLGSPAMIARINLQDRSGNPQPIFYVDELRLLAGTTAPPPTGEGGTITLNATGTGQAIDPRIRGTNLPTWLGADRLANGTMRARTAASGITVIRLPGGSWSNHYGWLSCELRANQANALPCGDNWGSWAARPTDFIDFLQATGTQGMWVVSINSTPQEAAAAVAFFNATPTDTTVIGVDSNGFDWQTAGHWAQLRAEQGNPDPVGIQLWAVGNEVYGGTPASGGAQCQPWGWEDVWSCDGTEYVNGVSGHAGYTAFRSAMRAVDPTIQVGAVGVTPGTDYNSWGNEVVAAAGATMDFYDIHQYGFFEPPANNTALLAAPQSAWPAIMGDVRATFANQGGGRAIPVGVTEYNLFSVQDQDNGQLLTRAVNALYLADTIGQMIREGVVLANQWDLANGRAGNGTEYGLLHEDNNFYRSPQYYIFPLWERFGTTLLPTSSTFDAATELSIYGGQPAANSYSLLAINKTGQSLSSMITINGAAGARAISGGTVDLLQTTALAAQAVTFNNVSDPADDLSDAPPLPLPIARATTTLAYTFAPHSVTLLRLQVDSGAPVATATPTPTGTGTPTRLPPTAPPVGQGVFLPLVTR